VLPSSLGGRRLTTDEGPKEGRCRPHSHFGGAGLKGGGELQAKPSEAQGKGELCDHRVRSHGSGRRVLHQVEGGEKHLPSGGGDVSPDHTVMRVR
jgi:hypothetical protein